MAVTILDIAKASGKSFPTVSRALNDHPKISVKTKQEIWALAGKMGYRPSFAGKVLKNGFTRILSVIVPDLADPFYAEFVRCFKADAADNGYDVVVYDYEMKRDLESRYLEMMLTGCCDGVAAFVTSFEHTAVCVNRLWEARIPLVAIGTPDHSQVHYDGVNVDSREALNRIFGELHRRGKRNLAFVFGRMSEALFAQVKEYMIPTLKDLPLQFDAERNFYCAAENGTSQAEDGYRIGCEIFARNPAIDTIMTWHGVQAYGIQRAAQEAGKRIPEDVALIARDNTWVTRYAAFPMAALDQRLDQVAKEAFAIIKERLRNKEWQEPFRRIVKAEHV